MVDHIGHLHRLLLGIRHLESRHPLLESLLLENRRLGSRLPESHHPGSLLPESHHPGSLLLESHHPGSLLLGIRRLENLLLESRPGSLQLLAAVDHLKNNLDDNSSHTYPSLQTSRCNVCKTPTRGELSSIFLRADESYLERVLSVH